jgi:hypothetical protein
MVHYDSWMGFYHLGIPELQERTFNPDARGSFDLYWKADQVISPEPYRLPAYYRNEISLREAFDVCINGSTDHSDLPPMQLNISLVEKRKAYEILEQAKKNIRNQRPLYCNLMVLLQLHMHLVFLMIV